MIEQTIEKWHRFLRGQLPGGLDELLHDDVVFHSPILFTPQVGKDITKMYLHAAYMVFGGDDGPTSESTDGGGEAEADLGRSFRYVRQTMSGHSAALEFETRMDGKYVNGVDLITCDDEGRIVEFKVMIRPLQAVNLVHERMRAMLAAGAPDPA